MVEGSSPFAGAFFTHEIFFQEHSKQTISENQKFLILLHLIISRRQLNFLFLCELAVPATTELLDISWSFYREDPKFPGVVVIALILPKFTVVVIVLRTFLAVSFGVVVWLLSFSVIRKELAYKLFYPFSILEYWSIEMKPLLLLSLPSPWSS